MAELTQLTGDSQRCAQLLYFTTPSVTADGSITRRHLVDATGAVTGIEERWVRRCQILPRKS